MRPHTPHFRGPVASGRRSAFTAVELFAVVGTLTVLASVCLPSLSSARLKAQQAVCHMNLKELGIAWDDFATDHDGWILPAWISPRSKAAFPMGCPKSLAEPGVWWQKLSKQAYLDSQGAAALPEVFHCPADGSPVVATYGGRTYRHSYVYMDYFGFSYGTNPDRWPESRMYGVKRLSGITKHPGQTPVMLEAKTGKYKRGDLVVPSGGYANLPNSRWMALRHEHTGNILFDDGHVDAVTKDHPALGYDCRDLF